MKTQQELQTKLVELLGNNHVYYQAPESLKMEYPCIRYSRSDILSNNADNAKYLKQQSSAGIAVIIKGTQNMLFSALVEPMQRLIEKHGYVSMMHYIGEEDNELEYANRICMERRPMGILFLGSLQENLKKLRLIPEMKLKSWQMYLYIVFLWQMLWELI